MKPEWLNNLPVMVFQSLWNDQRPILESNDGSLTLIGYSPDRMLASGFSFTALIHPDDRQIVCSKIGQAVQDHLPYDLVYRIKTESGREKWVREQGRMLNGADGGEPVLASVLSDHQEQITKLRLLEQRIADRSGRLAALYDILEAVSDAATLPSTCSRILERVLQAIDLDAGAIHLIDSSSEILDLIAHSGLPANILETNRALQVQTSPLVGWIARNAKPLLLTNIDRDRRSRSFVQNSAFTLYAGVPITSSEKTYGVLSLLALENNQVQVKEAMDLLLSVGEQIGVVVENAQLREDAQQLQIVEERNRLARELHDSVTQSLYSVTLFAEAGRRMIAQGDTNQAAVYLSDVTHTGRQALKEMRLLVHRLRPSILAQEGLVQAIQQRLNAVEGRAGVHNQLLVEGDLELPPRVEEALYHIIQEALNNALKHSAANEVIVSFHADGNGLLDVLVKDNGRGFDPDQVAGTGGLGLTSMRERAELFGGTLSCQSQPGEGTSIRVQFPPLNE